MGSFSPLTREECKVDKGRERMQFFCDFSGTKKLHPFPSAPFSKIPKNLVKKMNKK